MTIISAIIRLYELSHMSRAEKLAGLVKWPASQGDVNVCLPSVLFWLTDLGSVTCWWHPVILVPRFIPLAALPCLWNGWT
jgi:hypothetical protein